MRLLPPAILVVSLVSAGLGIACGGGRAVAPGELDATIADAGAVDAGPRCPKGCDLYASRTGPTGCEPLIACDCYADSSIAGEWAGWDAGCRPFSGPPKPPYKVQWVSAA